MMGICFTHVPTISCGNERAPTLGNSNPKKRFELFHDPMHREDHSSCGIGGNHGTGRLMKFCHVNTLPTRVEWR